LALHVYRWDSHPLSATLLPMLRSAVVDSGGAGLDLLELQSLYQRDYWHLLGWSRGEGRQKPSSNSGNSESFHNNSKVQRPKFYTFRALLAARLSHELHFASLAVPTCGHASPPDNSVILPYRLSYWHWPTIQRSIRAKQGWLDATIHETLNPSSFPTDVLYILLLLQ
jgi:hypothetical protein